VMLRDPAASLALGLERDVWLELGVYDAPNQRKAIEATMEATEDLIEGDFRAIPESSGKVYSPRAVVQVTWGTEAPSPTEANTA
jgi:hypothetical protein